MNSRPKFVFEVTYRLPAGAGSALVYSETKADARRAVLARIPEAYNVRVYNARVCEGEQS